MSLRNGQEGDWLAVAVQDTGIGLTQTQLGRLFEEFGQLETLASRRQGGSGLGLVLSRKLAGLLEGKIEVVSQRGQGSTFTLVLPAGSTKNRN